MRQSTKQQNTKQSNRSIKHLRKQQNKESEKPRRNVPIEKIILHIVAAAGIMAAVAIAPGVGPALKMFGFGKRKYPDRYVKGAIGRLVDKGYIMFEEKNDKKFLRITKKGNEQLQRYQDGNIAIKKPRKWDKKWRIIIFDIPEKRRSIRNKVRASLINFGFIRLQNSVWICPYECEELIIMLKAKCKIGKDILYIVAERVEYDKNYKEFFKL